MSGKRKADLKVIILGDYAVGKTSLLRRYIDGKFKEHEEPTVGAAFYLKQWGPYNVAIWDTAGDEKYSGLSHFYCRSAGAAILAFDLTNATTFESLWARFSSILEAANEDCIKIVVGTKSDLMDMDNRQITFDEGRRFSRELNESTVDMKRLPHDPYFETSSLKNENVSDVFDYIFQYCLPLSADQKKKQSTQNSQGIVDLMEASGAQSGSKKQCCKS